MTQNTSQIEMICESPRMKEIVGLIKRIAKHRVNILITGASGTGKELIARTVHHSGPQSLAPFIPVNCSSIPEGLLESELFGHAKGSFTGALQSRKGLFQEAHGGTLFLDEIGDMSLCLQAKLLRVLQDRKIRPVGDNTERFVDVRIIAATHHDLKKAIKSGHFREDLYYRLHVVDISLPSLCERRDDIPHLVRHFVAKYSSQHKINQIVVPDNVLKFLCEQNWPGNIRQLENAIERALTVKEGAALTVADFGLDEDSPIQFTKNSEYPSLKDVEMLYISYVLAKTNGKKEQAAKILKIDRTTLHRKITESKITPSVPSPSFDLTESLIDEENLPPIVSTLPNQFSSSFHIGANNQAL